MWLANLQLCVLGVASITFGVESFIQEVQMRPTSDLGIMPLKLLACQPGAANQQFGYTPDLNGTSISSMGYCLDINKYGKTAGSQVDAYPCGGTRVRQNEYWTVKGNTIVSLQSSTPFCFGIDNGTGVLVDCTAPSGQFNISFTATTNGTIVQNLLCLTASGSSPPPGPPKPPCPPPTPPTPPGPAPKGTTPCDIYDNAGTPCVAAHSMVRALYSAYNGALYRVIRASDNQTMDIGLLTIGGYANSSIQDEFCDRSSCVVGRIFDQSPRGNHLDIFGKDTGVNASRDKHMVGGHAVYSAYFEPGMGYRNDNTSGIVTGQQSESMYMVTSGTHYNDRCCFDYGNAETDAHDDGGGTMEAICFGNATKYWRKKPINGTGPWVMADIEAGMYPGDDHIDPDTIPTMSTPYVTAMLKGRVCEMSLKGADATTGDLMTLYDGVRPEHGHYNPMKLQGAIILGTGGDNSHGARGTFFEGAMTTGYTNGAVDNAIQANIVGAMYGR
eukprot:m.98351 g.98351  ORF g.98351 m.98351 type:complete len:499 (-) comp27056_c0_seq1:164-1660(-)